LLVPATAMGATLPMLTRALSERDPNFGSVLGRLYGYNTIGAVLGALAAEVCLVGWFGVRGTAGVSASIYLAAAAVALAVERSLSAWRRGDREGFVRAEPREASCAAARGELVRRRLAAARVRGGLVPAPPPLRRSERAHLLDPAGGGAVRDRARRARRRARAL